MRQYESNIKKGNWTMVKLKFAVGYFRSGEAATQA